MIPSSLTFLMRLRRVLPLITATVHQSFPFSVFSTPLILSGKRASDGFWTIGAKVPSKSRHNRMCDSFSELMTRGHAARKCFINEWTLYPGVQFLDQPNGTSSAPSLARQVLEGGFDDECGSRLEAETRRIPYFWRPAP
jgi:hypothetical protein